METIEALSKNGENALKAEQANNARNQFSFLKGKDLDDVRELVKGKSIESQSTLIVMNQLLMGSNLSAAADKELVIELMKWMKDKSSTDELIKLLKDNEGMKETFGGNEKVILQSIQNMYNKVHSTLTQGTKDRSYKYEPLKIKDDKDKNDITLETLNIPYLDKNTYNKVLRGLSEAEIENKKLRDKENIFSGNSRIARKFDEKNNMLALGMDKDKINKIQAMDDDFSNVIKTGRDSLVSATTKSFDEIYAKADDITKLELLNYKSLAMLYPEKVPDHIKKHLGI
ncbi:hypothetical protein CFT12S02225_00145 [Campylobacter fetus subsp. testudinum]|uniref:Uncharacterized protein n=2 Tax=Campylobacter fetus TaxID=196 RepID=A0AAX0HD11_CAMFE|nr:hypothetical protein [Campylobacter fetus]OCR91510.1 hypothetical protein CFT12S02225_00145 [Campylobacter fetus subsp. testudinum]